MYRKAEALLVTETPIFAGAGAVRAALAACRSRLGLLLHGTGRTDEALSVYRLARADQQAVAAAPRPDEARSCLADTIQDISNLLSDTGKPLEAEAEYRKALAIYQKLASDNPTANDFRRIGGDPHEPRHLVVSDG